MHPYPTTDPMDGAAPEEWRSVVGYEGLYSVSSLGRLRSDRKTTCSYPGRLVALRLQRLGYLRVWLSKDGIKRPLFVHRLVAEAFIGQRPDGQFINHRNGVKTDNRPANLEWLTRAENMAHAARTGLTARGDKNAGRLYPETRARGDRNGARLHPERLARGERNSSAKLTEADVRAILASSLTMNALAQQYGVSRSLIEKIRYRQVWAHINV